MCTVRQLRPEQQPRNIKRACRLACCAVCSLALSRITMVSLLESYLDFFYAKEILYRLPEVIRQKCEGCLYDSLSQTDHTCLSYTRRYYFTLYVDDILRLIDEQVILLKWREAAVTLSQVSTECIALFALKLDSEEWRETMKTPSWKYRMTKMAVQLMRLERYF